MSPWTMLHERGLSLGDHLSFARGPERLKLAALAIHDARVALESQTGDDVTAVRVLLSALEAAHREIAP